MTNYVQALGYLVPNAKIKYKGTTVAYADIVWLDERTQPTQAECDSIWPQAEYEIAYFVVQNQRQSRYVAETDGLFFNAMRTGAELTEWSAAVNAIKAELPYPNPVG